MPRSPLRGCARPGQSQTSPDSFCAWRPAAARRRRVTDADSSGDKVHRVPPIVRRPVLTHNLLVFRTGRRAGGLP
ncbi:MAG TPA: hypothetical protein VGH53_19255, partial [Streptosporangiaceae bacterium]